MPVPVLNRPAPRRRPVIASAAFLPSDLANLSLWLRADTQVFRDAGGTLPATADGDSALLWKDQSTPPFNFASSGINAPVLKTAGNGINNVPVLRFDGVDDYFLNNVNVLSDYITAAAYTLFVAARVVAVDTNTANTWENDGLVADAGGYFGTFMKSTPSLSAFNYTTSDDKVSLALALSTPFAVEQRHESGSLYLRRTGLAEVSVATGNTASLAGNLWIGRAGTVTAILNGDIAEAIIYQRALSAVERGQVRGYLATRYGLTW
jgi:hypothetical protein